MSEKSQGPRLVIDNEPRERRLFELAQQRVATRNPRYTYDDLLAEVEALKKEGERVGD
jgi:hypothetical protein